MLCDMCEHLTYHRSGRCERCRRSVRNGDKIIGGGIVGGIIGGPIGIVAGGILGSLFGEPDDD